MISTIITDLFIGKTASPWPGRPATAIAKKPVRGPLAIGSHGLLGDQQADLRVHGGPEKAIHHYSADHMDFWIERFPERKDRFEPGCFGENLSTTGVGENDLCLGDVLRLGTALVEVCQGRQPCWKLNAHLELDQLALEFQRSGRTGWYYRVLEDGAVAVGDSLSLQDRPYPEWPLAEIIKLRFQRHIEPRSARRLSQNAALSESWRRAFGKKASPDFVESTGPRLNPPEGGQ